MMSENTHALEEGAVRANIPWGVKKDTVSPSLCRSAGPHVQRTISPNYSLRALDLIITVKYSHLNNPFRSGTSTPGGTLMEAVPDPRPR